MFPFGGRLRGFLPGTSLLGVFLALMFVQLLGSRFFFRLDCTSDQRYRLAEDTRTLLRALPDPVVLRFYLTSGLPEPYQTQGRYVFDLLQEYRRAGENKVVVETIAPNSSEEMERELRRLHIEPKPFTQIGSDQYQVRLGYFALVIRYQDKEDVLPFLPEADNLEYEISSRLRTLNQKEKKNLFFISNHNEVSPQFIKEGPAKRLFDEFHVESTRLSKAAPGLTPHLVFLLGPQNQLSDEEIDVLDHHLASGVPLVVALNRRAVLQQSFHSVAQTTGLEPLLEHYGVRVERDFVMDRYCNNIALRSEGTSFLVKYFPFVMARDLARENPALKKIDVLGFPFVTALSSTLATSSALTYKVLARSSENSWIWPGLADLSPPSLQTQMETVPPSKFTPAQRIQNQGPFALAVTVEGSTVSFRAPHGPAPHVKLVVIGTSFFANPQIPNPEANPLFILSLAQWLTQNGTDLAIPPKGSPFRPLKPLPSWAIPLVKYFGLFSLPLLVALAGFLHWENRQRKKEKIQAAFSRQK